MEFLILVGIAGFKRKMAARAAALLVAGLLAAAAGGYKDPAQPVERRVDDLLRRMTLAEKIGQMSQIDTHNATACVIRDYCIGSVMSVKSFKASAPAMQEMIAGMQRAALSTRLGIPIIFGTDAVHGHSMADKATIFPHNIALGCTRDPQLAERIGAAVALEVRATGVPYVFGPCVAVCRDPRWSRCYDSFSEDPELVQQMTAIINGFQGTTAADARKGVPYLQGTRNAAATAKHYVGDGGTFNGTDEGDAKISFDTLLKVHMPPYYSAVARGVSAVMVSYSSWNGVKMHTNRYLITDFLKGELRFRGFVMTDSAGLDKITNPPHADYPLSIKIGILAGIDMVMLPYSYTEFIADLTELVNNGTVPMSRVDDAVRRILRVKFTMGLFESPFPDPSLTSELGAQDHRELAREAVRKSLVLLKNGKPGEEPLLPLPKKSGKILVAGGHADNIGYQCGPWTSTSQGTTILDAIKATVDHSTEVVYSENPGCDFLEQNRNEGSFSYAVVVVGEVLNWPEQNVNLTFPEPGPTVIKNVCGGIRCVVVLISAQPLVVEPYVDMADAFVAAWMPGTEGQGVADVLYGDFGFTGKLSRTWFRSLSQLPMNVGDVHYDPLFPFGYGLTTSVSSPARENNKMVMK